MGSLSRKMQRASARKKDRVLAVPTRQMEHTEDGIFCDCYGTLYSHSYTKDDLLVAYLNAKHEAGTPVTLVSTAPQDVIGKIRNIGLHKEILMSLMPKTVYHNDVLEILIDDDPTLKAKTLWHPQNEAFRAQMKDFLDRNPAPRISL